MLKVLVEGRDLGLIVGINNKQFEVIAPDFNLLACTGVFDFKFFEVPL